MKATTQKFKQIMASGNARDYVVKVDLTLADDPNTPTVLHLTEQNGLRLFGSYIEFRSLRAALQTNQEAVILDSAYLYLVISQGVAATGVMLWLFARSMRAQIRKRQYVLLITMGVFLLSGLMERFTLDAAMNFALLSTFSALNQEAQNT